jgi:YD repeat-containing protein
MGSRTYVVGYDYDAFGRLQTLTYPSLRTVTYEYDPVGRVNLVRTTKAGQSQIVVQNVSYYPFGAVEGYTLGNGPQGNGRVYTRGIDLSGRIATYTLGGTTFAVGYDAANRVEFISQTIPPQNPPNSNTNTYIHDNLDRLTDAFLPGTTYVYGYDEVGNRRSRRAGTALDTYHVSTTSNRITSIDTSSGTRPFNYDNNGSTEGDGINSYLYDVRGRMKQSSGALGVTNYQVNALGQRIRKTRGTLDTVFHYDTGGKLIAETDASGATKREFIYLGDIPVGVVQ